MVRLETSRGDIVIDLDAGRVGRETSPSPSSNRKCGFPASGFPVRHR